MLSIGHYKGAHTRSLWAVCVTAGTNAFVSGHRVKRIFRDYQKGLRQCGNQRVRPARSPHQYFKSCGSDGPDQEGSKEIEGVPAWRAKERKSETKMGPASTILHFWHKDSAFLDSAGNPLELSREGPGASFQELARRYGGDVPAGALLSELQRTGAVVETRDNQFKVTTRYFLPTGASEIFIDAVSFSLENLSHTASQNVINADHQGANFLERFVCSDRIDEEGAERFRILAKEKSLALLEFLDDWILSLIHI